MKTFRDLETTSSVDSSVCSRQNGNVCWQLFYFKCWGIEKATFSMCVISILKGKKHKKGRNLYEWKRGRLKENKKKEYLVIRILRRLLRIGSWLFSKLTRTYNFIVKKLISFYGSLYRVTENQNVSLLKFANFISILTRPLESYLFFKS